MTIPTFTWHAVDLVEEGEDRIGTHCAVRSTVINDTVVVHVDRTSQDPANAYTGRLYLRNRAETQALYDALGAHLRANPAR